MSDHFSSPKALADPVFDITDLYVFPSPQQPGALVLILDAFPFAGPGALFSDAVDYRFRVRPVGIAAAGEKAAFAVGETEYTFSCRFGAPVELAGGGQLAQEGTLTAASGDAVTFRTNDEQGGRGAGMRVFAGLRMDPFFFDGLRALRDTITKKQLAFETVGDNLFFRQNVLSLVVEVDVAKTFGADSGPLFAVIGETVRPGSIAIRLERAGRPEIKNVVLGPTGFDPLNRDIDIRDLYNDEDAFKLRPVFLNAYRARLNANLAFYDELDAKTDWQLQPNGTHPLTELLLADFQVVDVSKPYAEDSYFEIEQMLLRGARHKTCGGRTPNDDCMDTFYTTLVNNGNGPRISDGVHKPTVPASRLFPYLASPELEPPTPTLQSTHA